MITNQNRNPVKLKSKAIIQPSIIRPIVTTHAIHGDSRFLVDILMYHYAAHPRILWAGRIPRGGEKYSVDLPS